MALGMGGGKRGWHMGHVIGGIVTLAVAVYLGISVLPGLVSKLGGMFQKKA